RRATGLRRPGAKLRGSMRPRAPSVLFVLAALAAVRPVGTQIRNLLPITTSGEEHVDAVLSPTGDHVAFRGPDKLAVVAYAGGQEVTLAMGRNLGSFRSEERRVGDKWRRRT